MSIEGGSLISSIYTNVCLLCYTIQGMLTGLSSFFFFFFRFFTQQFFFFTFFLLSFPYSLYYLHRGARILHHVPWRTFLHIPFLLSPISSLFCTRCVFYLYIVILYLGKKVLWISVCFFAPFILKTSQRVEIVL